MRSPEELFQEVADEIAIVAAAKRELKQNTIELVAQMKADGHDRAWGVEYMELVGKAVDKDTANWAMHYFDEAWPEEGPRTVNLADDNPDPRER